MSKTVIKIENLSKIYRLGEVGTGTLSHDLNRWVRMNLLGQDDPYAKIGHVNDRTAPPQPSPKGRGKWKGIIPPMGGTRGAGELVAALRDINLEVKEGEVLGIIGKNGAGKSTLLKLLSRVTSPTTGSIKVKGRLASLLEVGTGFHPEMTGRENIYMNGTIMGMRKWEIDRKLDEIVDFAGVAKYLDTPTKRYSSGMTVRLGFAIAAHLEPEILVVDEVLAVGDAEFQKKAIGKMQDVSTNDGRTVLFVSHNMASMRNLCNNGIVIKNGLIEFESSISKAVNYYENSLSNDDKPYWVNEFIENLPARLNKIEIKDINNELRNSFRTSENIKILFHVSCMEKEIKNVKLGFDLIRRGEIVFRSQQVDSTDVDIINEKEKYTFICTIPKWMLNEGEYFLRPLFSIHCVQSLIKKTDAVIKINMQIDAVNSHYHQLLNETNHPGTIFPILKWQVITK